MVIPRLIERKRDGGVLTDGEWEGLVRGFTDGTIPDYQIAALLMAVVFRGLAPAELAALTRAMRQSGSQLAFPADTARRVDKHSTGGVGDKTSLILVPLLAACGVAVPMMAGRGLGHTGGTLDKLEAIPGFRTGLTAGEVTRQVGTIGCAVFGQSASIAPADRRLYALRDVTATVESVPLIAASIMSKKLAEDLDGLVLDVKVGRGGFLPTPEAARELAAVMLELGESCGCRTVALLTAMDRPLGRACGNALEVEEALQVLEGAGPPDVRELVLALGAEMLQLAQPALAAVEARAQLVAALDSGAARARMASLIEAQGGNPAVVDDPAALPQAREVEIYRAARDGVVESIDPRPIGEAIVAMGGGRRRLDDAVDPSVGFVITARPGDRVERGEPLASVFAADRDGIGVGTAALDGAVRLGEAADALPLLLARLTPAGTGAAA